MISDDDVKAKRKLLELFHAVVPHFIKSDHSIFTLKKQPIYLIQ